MSDKPSGSTGIATVLAEMLAGGGGDLAGDDGQVELFDPAEFGDDLPGPVTPVGKSGPQGGRPRGARNKSTEQMRRYILSRYKHPLIVAAEMWSRTPEDLAREMGLYVREYYEGVEIAKHLDTKFAAQLIENARISSMPYFSQKLPIEITQKITQRGLVVTGDLRDLADAARQIEHSPLGGDPE